MRIKRIMSTVIHFSYHSSAHQTCSKPDDGSMGVMIQLSDIIRVQNQTINLLEDALNAKSEIPNVAQLLLSVSQKEERLSALTTELKLLQDKLDSRTIDVNVAGRTNSDFDESTTTVSSSFLVPQQEGLQKECSAKYGEMTVIYNDE